MFYFLLSSLLSYKVLLIIAAVVPALFLMVKVYRSDRLEPEDPAFLWVLIRSGILAALIALVLERVFGFILNHTVKDEGTYQVLLYFVVVAFSEEGAKYFMMHRASWRSVEFNCQYDGVVYAVFTSLGFALWENISYVVHYGFSTALVRAVTAIPGHASFGVFMGVFYGIARRLENQGLQKESRWCRILAVIMPALLHGTYDYIASTELDSVWFIPFVVVLFAVSFIMVNRTAREDRFIR